MTFEDLTVFKNKYENTTTIKKTEKKADWDWKDWQVKEEKSMKNNNNCVEGILRMCWFVTTYKAIENVRETVKTTKQTSLLNLTTNSWIQCCCSIY